MTRSTSTDHDCLKLQPAIGSICKHPCDLSLIHAAIGLEANARERLWHLVMQLPLARSSACRCFDSQNEHAEFATRVWSRPAMLKGYRGDAPLASYIATAFDRWCASTARKERRRTALLRSPEFHARCTETEKRPIIGSVARGPLEVRDSLYHACWEAYFKTHGAGAPVGLAGACRRGLLKQLRWLSSMHLDLLETGIVHGESWEHLMRNCLEFGERPSDSCQPVLESVLTAYANAGQNGPELVLHGGACIVELVEMVHEAFAYAPQRLRKELHSDLAPLREQGERLARRLRAA